jgi:hypothetical protein
MTEAQAKEAEAIMREQQAEIEALTKQQQRTSGDREGGTKNHLCTGCLRWRCVLALMVGAGLGVFAWTRCEEHTEFLKSYFGAADTPALAITAIVSLLPVAAVAVGWKIRLYTAGYPGIIRACVNMLTEFKRGLRG